MAKKRKPFCLLVVRGRGNGSVRCFATKKAAGHAMDKASHCRKHPADCSLEGSGSFLVKEWQAPKQKRKRR